MKAVPNCSEEISHPEGSGCNLNNLSAWLYSNPPSEVTSKLLVDAENNLRFTIGRYIHDHPQQQLQIAISLLQEQAETLAQNPAEAIRQMAEINQRLLELLNQSDRELSLLRREVLPSDPRSGTLRLTVESYIVDDFPRLHPAAPFEIKYWLDELGRIYDSSAEGCKYVAEKMLISLFVREGLKNAYKHSQASRVEIESKVIYYRPTSVKLNLFDSRSKTPVDGYYLRVAVKDNGCGFAVDCLPGLQAGGRHYSFYDFEARVHMLGGFTRLLSSEGLGTLWELYLPLPSAAEEAVSDNPPITASTVLGELLPAQLAS